MKLPDKPSEVLGVAIEDVKKCYADPRYVVDMGHWHTEFENGCHVCLGGSVIAQRLRPDLGDCFYPERVHCPHARSKLRFLDNVRKGGDEYIDEALAIMGVNHHTRNRVVEATRNDLVGFESPTRFFDQKDDRHDFDEFIKELERIKKIFEEEGI